MLSTRVYRKYSIGNALVEYILPGSIILLATLGILIMIGANLKHSFLDLKQKMLQSSKTSTEQENLHNQAKAAFLQFQGSERIGSHLSIKAYSAGSASSSNSLCSDSWCIDAPGLTGNSVNTAGSNGETAQLTYSAANVFVQVAKILQDRGEDPNTVALLTQMANQGHAIGDSQAGLLSKSGDYNAMNANINNMQSGLSNFQQLSQQLNAVLPNMPSSTQGILSNASQVIIATGSSFSFNGSSGGQIGWNFTSTQVNLTQSNSNTICQNGGNTAQCLR